MTTQIISAFLQIFVFTLVPFVVYLVNKKTTQGFFDFIGLSKTTGKALWLAAITSSLFVLGGIALAFMSNEIREILITPPSVTGMLRQMGFNATTIFTLLVISLLKTSLSEEILFRGFIAKRCVAKFGFHYGNIIQSLIFAIIHVLVFWAASQANYVFLVFIFILSGTAGFIIEYINEKYGNGSILPGWLAHGLGNTVSYFILAFAI